MERWYLILVCSLMVQLTFGIPFAQLQLPQYPQFINYVGNAPLPGGRPASFFSANFTPGQIVTGSGIPTFSGNTGFSAAVDMVGNTVSRAGAALGNSLGSFVQGIVHGAAMLISGVFGMGRVNTNVITYDNPIG